LNPLTIGDLKFAEGRYAELYHFSWGTAGKQYTISILTRDGMEDISYLSSSDRSQGWSVRRLSNLPMLVSIYPGQTPIRKGEVYVTVALRFGGTCLWPLLAGYIYDGHRLTWPPGFFEGMTEGPGLLRSITGTNPAAGAEISEAVPTNARWRIKSLIFTLVTDGTVANRLVKIVIDDGANALSKGSCGNYQTASQTYVYTGGAGLYPSSLLIGYWNIVLPEMPILFQGWRIRTETDTIQAGDNYGAPQLLVEEWIQE